jgi:hypothetical protein
MTYPRARAKSLIVDAAREVRLPVSSFMVMASLNTAAALRGYQVADLIPQTELSQYLRRK